MFIVTAYDSRINSTVTGASYDTAAAALDAIRCCIPSAVASIDYDPAAVDAFVVRAAALADEGGTIQADGVVSLFPGQPTAHRVMSIRAAVQRQFPGLDGLDVDRSFERVWS